MNRVYLRSERTIFHPVSGRIGGFSARRVLVWMLRRCLCLRTRLGTCSSEHAPGREPVQKHFGPCQLNERDFHELLPCCEPRKGLLVQRTVNSYETWRDPIWPLGFAVHSARYALGKDQPPDTSVFCESINSSKRSTTSLGQAWLPFQTMRFHP